VGILKGKKREKPKKCIAKSALMNAARYPTRRAAFLWPYRREKIDKWVRTFAKA